jgi:hypothetical protein
MKRDSILPKGVGVRIMDTDGSITDIHDPYLKKLKWDDVRVDSSKFKKLPSWRRLFLLSIEFLNTAKIVCIEAGELGKNIRWTQGSISFYCIHLATELFLKSCLKKYGKKIKLNHNVGDLYKKYCEVFNNKYCFPTPWGISGTELNKILGSDIFSGIDLNTDQMYRYFENKEGNTPKATHFFSPGYQMNYIIDLEKRWRKIQNSIIEINE